MSYKYYYVNKNAQNNGDHEVHTEDCEYLPSSSNREYLGYYSDCAQAVTQAKEMGYSKANGCYWCANKCHTS
ncbi:hypothetical protein E5475_18610 [Salmonella enterica]|nr:hypothetical protein [Salmonella enterica]